MPRRGHAPQRTCLACRARRASGELLRLVVDAAGEAHVDPSRAAPGRGAWLCPSAGCIGRLRAGVLARALRHPHIRVADLAGEARELADSALAAALVQAHRSGLVVSGVGRIEHGGGSVPPLVLIVAADAGKTTLESLRRAHPGCTLDTVPLTATQLGGLLGKGRRAAIVMLPGAPSGRFVHELRLRRDLG